MAIGAVAVIAVNVCAKRRMTKKADGLEKAMRVQFSQVWEGETKPNEEPRAGTMDIDRRLRNTQSNVQCIQTAVLAALIANPRSTARDQAKELMERYTGGKTTRRRKSCCWSTGRWRN